MNKGQRDQLLKPLNPSRVAQRKGGGGRQLSYLEAWETRAHLIRVFGFGGYSSEVLTSELMFEEKMEKNWAVGYKVELRLHIKDLDATYTEAAVGSAMLPQRGEAHDMAVKTAESDAFKRAAINLGTQFGLSLDSDGSLKDVVGKTLDVDTLPEESA
jgi:recombination DNA repair RAD52 pathway protein